MLLKQLPQKRLLLLISLALLTFSFLLKYQPADYQHQHEKGRAGLTIWTSLPNFQHPFFDQQHPSKFSWMELVHVRNAIESWRHLKDVNLLLFGNSEACRFIHQHVSRAITCLPYPCINPEFEMGLTDCLWKKVYAMAETEFIMFSHPDMIFFNDVIPLLKLVSEAHPKLLAFGKGRNYVSTVFFDFSDPDLYEILPQEAFEVGFPEESDRIDFLVIQSSYRLDFPPFLIDPPGWKKWLLTQFMQDPKSSSIDISLGLHAIHLDSSEPSSITEFDANKDFYSHFDYSLVPTSKSFSLQWRKPPHCPPCSYKLNERSLEAMLVKHSMNNTIIFTIFYGRTFDAILNWVCSLKRLGLNNFILYPLDPESYHQLRKLELPVLKFMNNSNLSDARKFTGRDLFERKMMLSTKILAMGYNLVFASIDMLFLRNPLNLVNSALINVHSEKDFPTGTFFAVNPTPETIRLFEEPILSDSLSTEHSFWKTVLSRSKNKGVSCRLLGDDIVAPSHQFFMTHEIQDAGIWPFMVLVTLNSTEREVNKIYKSLRIETSEGQCIPQFPLVPPPPLNSNPVISINLFASSRPDFLRRALESLKRVNYLQDLVNLFILFDVPARPSNEEAEARKEAIDLANEFEWSYGSKKVLVRDRTFGFANHRLNSWLPYSNLDLRIFVEDRHVLSPIAYRWLKSAVQAYYLNPDQYDSHLYGIALQPALVAYSKFESISFNRTAVQQSVFRHQGRTEGPLLLFPEHWNHFLSWLEERSKNPQFIPVLSNLIGYKELLGSDPSLSWHAWNARFIGERGFYLLYPNFEGLAASPAIEIEPELISRSTSKLLSFPALPDIPVFDFYHSLITENPVTLEGRALYADGIN